MIDGGTKNALLVVYHFSRVKNIVDVKLELE